MMARESVYGLINGEREYQDRRWTSATTTSGGIHSVEEWIVYCEDYLLEAKHLLSRNPKQIGDTAAMNVLRKVAAMIVCALEQHGADPRVML
jgi:hypothetical protein